MIPKKDKWYSPRYLILPGIYVVIVALTTALSRVEGRALYGSLGFQPSNEMRIKLYR